MRVLQGAVRGLHLPTCDARFARHEPYSYLNRSIVPYRFGRPVPPSQVLPSLLEEAGRLRAFQPPFSFTSFFSPEDTLLCQCASEAALSHARSSRLRTGKENGRDATRIAELTAGSGLVGLHLLRIERNSRLLGLDIDVEAAATATANASTLDLSGRTRFECADIWSDAATAMLFENQPHLIVCNPPYVPEPPDGKLAAEAGAGADGSAHVVRALEIAGLVRPRALALSWCSLSDPALVVGEAAKAGYRLNSLFIAAISDGEYSGSVCQYLRTLPHAYINEQQSTVAMVAPDGSATFAYLLMAGEFSLQASLDDVDGSIAAAVSKICSDFARAGLETLARPAAPFTVRAWLLDRWDELRLRAFLHGPIETMAAARR